VDTRVFPLYEVENGKDYTLNQVARTRPVKDYIEKQKRYRHVTEQEVDDMQDTVDAIWVRLMDRVAASKQTESANV